MSAPDQLNFAPLRKTVLTEIEAALYLRLDVGREDDPDAWVRAITRLVDARHVLKCLMYRHFRLYHIDDLDDFLQRIRK